MNYKTFRRRALQIAIGFLVLTALVAIVSVFMDDFGHVYTKILATCFTISVACLCIIASTAFIEQRQQVAIGTIGILLSLVAAGLIITGMWAEFRFDWYWKTSACLTVCAIASAHCFLLLIPQLARRQHPEQAIKSCLAILNLGSKYGQERLEAACQKALVLEQPHRKVILNLLANNKEQDLTHTEADDSPAVNHPNIRGQHYYQ